MRPKAALGESVKSVALVIDYCLPFWFFLVLLVLSIAWRTPVSFRYRCCSLVRPSVGVFVLSTIQSEIVSNSGQSVTKAKADKTEEQCATQSISVWLVELVQEIDEVNHRTFCSSSA